MAEFCCYDRASKGGCNGHDEPLATSTYLNNPPISLDVAREKAASARVALIAQRAYRDAVIAYDEAPCLGTAAEVMQGHAMFVDAAYPMLTLDERRQAKAFRFVRLVKDMAKRGVHFIEIDT